MIIDDKSAPHQNDQVVKTNTELPVIIRKWRGSGELLALFPTIAANVDNWYMCESFASSDGHSAANCEACINITDPVDIDDSKIRTLLDELKRVGYENLKVVKRETYTHRLERQRNWQQWHDSYLDDSE